jgi:hypothetical protein
MDLSFPVEERAGDFLSQVDQGGTGFQLAAFLQAL